MLSHVCVKRMVWLLLIASLVACVSPRERSQVLTEEILKDLPLPEGTTLLNSTMFERLSDTGTGTHFGIRGLYGCNTDYTLIIDQYRELLRSEGWLEFALTARGNPLFCNPDYEGIHLNLARLSDLENGALSMSDSLLSEYEAAYQTLYVVSISHFPFDETGTCE